MNINFCRKKLTAAGVLALVVMLAIFVGVRPACCAPSNVSITQVPAQTVNEGQELTFVVTAEDKSNATLLFSTGNLPTGATLTPATQTDPKKRSATFSWTPTFDQAGVYSNVIITATEDKNNPQSASTNFSITVGNVNRPPVLDPIGPKSGLEGQPLSFTISGSDPDTGDTLTFSTGDLPTGASFNPTSRTFSWTPNFNQAGNYNVLFKVQDNGIPPQSDDETVTITIGNVNRPPVLDPIGSKTVDEGQTLTFIVTGSDPDLDTVSFTTGPLPPGATFDSALQKFTWTPTYEQAGNYTVTFTITDSGDPNISVSEQVNITVNNVNRPPVLDPIGNQKVDENQLLTFKVTGNDPDGDKVTFSASNLPAGAAFDPATQTFSWTPTYDQAGSYENIVFSVSDGDLEDSETISITVSNVNRAPILNPIGDKTVNEGALLEFTVIATDPDGDTMTFSADSEGAALPANASFNPATKTFSWTPDYNQAGSYKVTFYVQDSGEPMKMVQETINITVGNVNRTPVFDPLGLMTPKEGTTLEFKVNAKDPDNDELTYSCSNLPAGATFDPANRTFTWPINYGQAGNYTVTFCATDNCADDPKSAEVSAFISVAMPTASELITNIVQYVYSLKLDKNVENSYIANLKKVDGFIAKGQLTPAINQLNATIQKIDQDLKKGGLIAPEYAAYLKLMINELLGMLSK